MGDYKKYGVEGKIIVRGRKVMVQTEFMIRDIKHNSEIDLYRFFKDHDGKALTVTVAEDKANLVCSTCQNVKRTVKAYRDTRDHWDWDIMIGDLLQDLEEVSG